MVNQSLHQSPILATVHTKKEPSMVFATVKMLSLTRFAARFSGLCQETVKTGTATSSAG
ncbi:MULTISPECIES: hypothetical protein [unclassified Mesorhizobium]|jgi:hypothetical protein|uniref:hypothetical protein n=1 Tax=unclassified Mesorhizobium TaxID=325217 RepID=UPI0016783457|nr:MULTISPECIES: hypothetical protein [unclassified Mesorhizobium]